MPAVGLAVIAFQQAILNSLVVDEEPLVFHEHVDGADDDAPRCRAAIVTVAATLALLPYEIAIDVMGLHRPRSEC